jgi:hypothetical protein
LGSALLFALSACREQDDQKDQKKAAGAAQPNRAAPSSTVSRESPRALYLPDGEDQVFNRGKLEPAVPIIPEATRGSAHCPDDMVSIRGAFCIDRFEASLVDARDRRLSPYYPPSREVIHDLLGMYRDMKPRGRQIPVLPLPPEFALQEEFEPVARSVLGVIPNGYLSGVTARRACEAAGKRLCTELEWTTACRGEAGTQFPYGAEYREGACNVHREAHPAALVHGEAGKHHMDPRLNLAEGAQGPLLRRTGATPTCRSAWGTDAVYDMVGNLDEWIESETGAFRGGFYSRATRAGCDAQITSHPPQYFDYSLGVRCCR